MRIIAQFIVAASFAIPAYALAIDDQSPTATKGESPHAAAATVPADPNQVIRCRRIDVTGSLLKRGRVCRTLAEWRRIDTNENDGARDLVGTGGVCSGGACRGN